MTEQEHMKRRYDEEDIMNKMGFITKLPKMPPLSFNESRQNASHGGSVFLALSRTFKTTQSINVNGSSQQQKTIITV
jgi:hypothetical protein